MAEIPDSERDLVNTVMEEPRALYARYRDRLGGLDQSLNKTEKDLKSGLLYAIGEELDEIDGRETQVFHVE